VEVTGTQERTRAASSDDSGDLVARSRGGDRDAFSELVRRFQDLVYNIISQRLSDADAALDAAQETFVKAYSNLASFRGESSFKCWLLSIALREAENQRRRRHRQLRAVALADRDPADGSPGPGAGIEVSDDVARVRSALAEAEEHDARLILLRDVEDLSYAEIAETLGVAVGTVKSGLSRARARLRAAIESPRPDAQRKVS
jgi:RNA polymerase sigma-70 factor (ECF subfamily)